jgi:hypothetical protein
VVGRTHVGRAAVAAVVALVVGGCGGQPVTTERQPSEHPAAVSPSLTFDRDVLAGVPDDCRLVETVGAPDDPSSEDAALGDVIASDLDAGLARGPLVAVDVGGQTGAAVLAAALFDEDTAVWVINPRADPATTAANRTAASVSTFPLQAVDTAGEDAVAYAIASAMDCSEVAAKPFRPVEPEPSPSMRPDLLVLARSVARPGDTVAMRFPAKTGRGVAFHLDQRVGDEWVTRYWLTSDGNGGRPVTVPVDTEGYGTSDVGVGGRGPDHVVLPTDVVPGDYRICTANAGDEFCAPIEIVGER